MVDSAYIVYQFLLELFILLTVNLYFSLRGVSSKSYLLPSFIAQVYFSLCLSYSTARSMFFYAFSWWWNMFFISFFSASFCCSFELKLCCNLFKMLLSILTYIITLCAYSNLRFQFHVIAIRWNLKNSDTQKNHCIWAGPWENVSYVICEQQWRRSACASAQSDQRLFLFAAETV